MLRLQSIRRTAHRLGAEPTETPCGTQHVCGVDLDDRIGPVDPHLGGRSVGAQQPRPGPAVDIAGQVGVGVIDLQVADEFAGAEVVCGAVDLFGTDRQLPFVGQDAGGSIELQRAVINQTVASAQIRMLPTPIRAGNDTRVGRGGLHPQPRLAERVADLDVEQKRITLARVQPRGHHDPVGLMSHRPPLPPPQQSMDRVVFAVHSSQRASIPSLASSNWRLWRR